MRFLVSRGTPDTAGYRLLSHTGISPSLSGLPSTFLLGYFHVARSIPRNARIPVWARPLSLAATCGITFVFSSSGYLDVSVHRVPSVHLWIQCTVHGVFPCGFPHSDICGSQCICHSPQLFAAYHVFLRLLVPRHPPCALILADQKTSLRSVFTSLHSKLADLSFEFVFRRS